LPSSDLMFYIIYIIGYFLTYAFSNPNLDKVKS